MDVGKRYAGLEPSFVAGICLAAFLPIGFYSFYSISSVSISIVTGLLVTLVIKHEILSRREEQTVLSLLAFALGTFCCSNGKLLEIGSTAEGWSLLTAASGLGKYMENLTDSIPFEDHRTNALIKALLTGNRENIPSSVKQAFRDSGASHILALSGLHLGIIYGIIRKATFFLGNSRKATIARSMIVISTCATYTLATGASASITRALTFIIIREAGKISGRPQELKTILTKSLFIQLAINPSDILDIGFQLSYGAMAGIAYIQPVFKKIWPDNGQTGLMRKIWDNASLSISCQITTGPLAWIHFRSFPAYFLLTNLLALPLTGLLIPSAILTAIWSAAGTCPNISIRITELLADSLIFVLETVASL